jgi:sugar-specific transcriptional regulator TrmB
LRREIKSSQDQILKTLLGLGLTRLDSQVYIYLAKKGPQGGQNLSKGLKVQKQQLYRSLKNLQKKGIVNANLEHPAQFYAVAFDKVVDIFVKSKMAEAQSIQENKNEILANWQAITLGQSSDPTAKFNIIEGRGSVYAKVLQMMKEAKDQLSTITTVIGLLRADQFGLFDDGLARQIKPRLQFRAITELSMQNLSITKNLFKDLSNRQIAFEGRIPDLSLTLPQLIIKDKDEILFFITPNGKEPSNPEQDDMCIWTNCQSLVQAFTGVFEDFWQNSTDIKVKITELETGKPAVPKTFIIKDSESAVKQYNTILNSAEEEIILVTSSAALTQLCKAKFLDDCHEKGVLVRIMAPITSQNLTAAQEISRYYEVRHVPAEYIGTTIVDGEHLFQFKNSPTKQGEQEAESYFDNTFYTNDSEYVEKTRTMLNDLWKNAQRPSIYTLKSETIMHKPSCVTLDSLIEFFPQAIYTNSTSNLQFGSKIIKEEPTKPKISLRR